MVKSNMTKKYKSLQTATDASVTKYPNRKTDQRNWISRNSFLFILIVIIILVLAQIALLSYSATTQTQSDDNSPSIEKTYKIGDKVDLDGKTVTVNGVAPYTTNNQLRQPQNGNKFVTIDISLTNSSKDAFNYDASEFFLQDNQSTRYSNVAIDHEPSLTTGELKSGQTSRGFIDYEIPAHITPTQLVYIPDIPGFLSTSRIIIDLTK